MEKLSLKKKLFVIRLYLEGLSYDEIAARASVGKGTVANIITDLKVGRFPEYGDLSEQMELIRELAVDLKRTRLTPIQAAVGVSVLSRLQELGVEPGEIEGLSALCRTLNADGINIQSFIRAALAFEEERERTGLSVEELEMKVQGLEESVNRLEPLAKEVADRKAQLTELNAQSESLIEEVAELEERHEILQEKMRDKEQRETELSNRVRDLEDRAQSADERLTTARKDLKMLSGIGMSLDNLSAFTQRLKVVAQRHGIKSEILCSRLMGELEQLDEGLGLDTVVEGKNQKLHEIEETILRAEEKSVGLVNTIEKLQQERSSLEATLSEERRHIIKDIKAINTVAENTITKLKQDLSTGVRESVIEVNKLKNQALQLGREFGQLNEMIELNKWLKGLQALAKGDEEVELNQVRVLGLTVLRSIQSRLDQAYKDSGSQPLLRASINNLIGGLEGWKP